MRLHKVMLHGFLTNMQSIACAWENLDFVQIQKDTSGLILCGGKLQSRVMNMLLCWLVMHITMVGYVMSFTILMPFGAFLFSFWIVFSSYKFPKLFSPFFRALWGIMNEQQRLTCMPNLNLMHKLCSILVTCMSMVKDFHLTFILPSDTMTKL